MVSAVSLMSESGSSSRAQRTSNTESIKTKKGFSKYLKYSFKSINLPSFLVQSMVEVPWYRAKNRIRTLLLSTRLFGSFYLSYKTKLKLCFEFFGYFPFINFLYLFGSLMSFDGEKYRN